MAKIALVTGANRGIGFEVARQLGKAGMTVILGSRDREKGAEAHSVLDKEGLRVRSQLLDLLNPGTARMAADFIGVKYGRLDVLVNNAGGFYDQEATPSKTSLKYLREALENNLIGTWSVIQAMLPLLLKSSSARIVNVSSGMGSYGDPQTGLGTLGGAAPAYALSKLALN
ncbi:MAG TPA: SDR family NAD(P)-dependent oxidoreductase, partial [bacterium]|nr:SDR family NAD(P)-dependent oxidoreductase [bacterium]